MLSTDAFSSGPLLPLVGDERLLLEQLVPADHLLRQILACVDLERFRPLLAQPYAPHSGRPALDPLVLLKLEILARTYRLSDREVINDARFHIAYRLFLGLSLRSPLPDPSTLSVFRSRIGPQILQQVFDDLGTQARQLGLTKDRLRLKDATHILANIAVPSTLQLVACVRDQLLHAAAPFAPERVADAQQQAAAVRLATEAAKDEVRLVQRVEHLRSILVWADTLPQTADFNRHDERTQRALLAALSVAHKVLADRAPEAGDRLLSVVDPDARCGKHGDFYEGYLVDVALDADSELITAVNVLPANGDEGADAAHLIAAEEAAQGNDVAQLSLDGAGYRGAVLRELTDPAGLNLEVFVPPKELPPPPAFPPERFTLTLVDAVATLTCPAGETTTRRERSSRDSGYKYRFNATQCGGCRLRGECLSSPEVKSRSVIKNDYEVEYQRAQAKATTAEYREVRRRHPAIERKLGELVNRHGLRQARYRGLGKVLFESVLTCLVVNLKRLVRLVGRPARRTETVRAQRTAG